MQQETPKAAEDSVNEPAESRTETAEAPDETEAAAQTEPDITAEQLAAAEAKAEENWQRVLRMQADMENLRRRTEKDLENARKFALEGFAKDLLPVLDSLELGLSAAQGDSEEVARFREGTELTLKQFHAALQSNQIDVIDPEGRPFNPEWHQAMSMQPSADHQPNTVLTVFQKGYSLNGRLLRPAMVVVSKAGQDAQPKIDEQA